MSTWNIWSVPAGVLSLLIIAPVMAIFYSAILGDTSLWPHLLSTVLPRYIFNTIVLMLGVGVLSLLFGVSSAWVISRYNFPGRAIFEWALLLPAAVPAGTAAGSNSAHSKIALPGKLYLEITQADDTPNRRLKTPTPSINTIVLKIYLGRTVDNKCGHREVSPNIAE